MSLYEKAEMEFGLKNYSEAKSLFLQFIEQFSKTDQNQSALLNLYLSYERALFIFNLERDQVGLSNTVMAYFKFLNSVGDHRKIIEKVENLLSQEEPPINRDYLLKNILRSLEHVGEISLEQKYLKIYIELCREKRLIESALVELNAYLKRFPFHLETLLDQIEFLVLKNDKQEIEGTLEFISKEILNKRNVKTGKAKKVFISKLNSLLVESLEKMSPSSLINCYLVKFFIWEESYEGSEGDDINLIREKKKKRTEKIWDLFKDAILIDPNSFDVFCHLAETLIHYESFAHAKRVINFIEREFANEALRKGSNLNITLEKIKSELNHTTDSNSMEDDSFDMSHDTIVLEDIEAELVGRSSSEKPKEISEKELGIKRLNKSLSEGKKLEALEIVIKLSAHFSDDPYLKKIKEDLLELESKPNSDSVKEMKESQVNQNVIYRNSFTGFSEVYDLWEKEILGRLKESNDFELGGSNPTDLILMLNSIGFFRASKYLSGVELEKIDKQKQIAKYLHFKYLQIMTCIFENNFYEALFTVEELNNTLPLNQEEKKCFLYLEAEILSCVGKREQALLLFKEVRSIDPNYRLVEERIKEIGQG